VSISDTLCGSSILLTGGTGSFGRAFAKEILKRCPTLKRLVIFSRDELKQFEMAQEFPKEKYPAIRFFLGDVRDQQRLKRALEGIDTVVHAAALKQVPAAEYNPLSSSKQTSWGRRTLLRPALMPR
jgi:UDP-N-acetylglucosamine 4,6-dehydratase/5-epimerase